RRLHSFPTRRSSDLRSPAWAYLFPASSLCANAHDGTLCRHHLHDSVVRKFLGIAVKQAGVTYKRVGTHTFRHSFATHLLANGTEDRKSTRLNSSHVK